jgi:EAL domain-containing protein (putative c-di-GMP-specific phosphodiesterase class I)
MENARSNFYGVLMGFNKYDDVEHFPELKFAEKDAEDLYETLTHPGYGNFPRENFTLLTGIVSTDRIQSALFTNIVRNRKKTDTILVYYSGHGFIAGDIKDAYLATPEATVNHLLSNPLAGLQVRTLQDYFLQTDAGTVIFVIDCCHSGAILLAPYRGKQDVYQLPLVDDRNYKAEGRIAFVSCPRGVTSRESEDYRNGIFSYFLLEGLKGKAIEAFSGEVTMQSLIAYVEAKAPPSQPPVHYGHSGRLVLATPHEAGQPPLAAGKPAGGAVGPLNIPQFDEHIHGLPNPLDHHLGLIDNLLGELGKQPDQGMVSQRILEAVRRTVNAEYAFVVRAEKDKRAYEKFTNTATDHVKQREAIISEVYPFLFSDKDELLRSRFGMLKAVRSGRRPPRNVIVIPLWTEYPREFLLLYGVNRKVVAEGEILGSVMKSLYQATAEFNKLNASRIENKILDGLKEHFGHVPNSVYDRRLRAFQTELNRIKFYFEPVVNLGKKNPQIDSWEALARDPETDRAPFHLFGAAELWGPGFIRELDIYCLHTAVTQYLRTWSQERGDHRKDQVSVNVYPETLFDEEYREMLNRIIIEEDLLKPKELVLEISERRSIPKSIYENLTDDPIELLECKIREYSSLFGIAFAIDDFGVGYSSVERLIRLELDHVKIDRQVLRQRNPQITIEYVLGLVRSMHAGQTNVIVEGFDGSSSISLYDLHRLGIVFVQGHLIRRASPTVAELGEESRDLLLKQVNTPPQKTFVNDDYNT